MLMTAQTRGLFVAANDNTMIAGEPPDDQMDINIISTSYQLTISILSDLLFDCLDLQDK